MTIELVRPESNNNKIKNATSVLQELKIFRINNGAEINL